MKQETRIRRLPPVYLLFPKLEVDVVLHRRRPDGKLPSGRLSSPPVVQRCSRGSSISRLTLPCEACWGDGFAVFLSPFEARFVRLLNSLDAAVLFPAFISSLGRNGSS